MMKVLKATLLGGAMALSVATAEAAVFTVTTGVVLPTVMVVFACDDSPLVSVTAVLGPIIDGLVSVTVTPGMTACVLSVTRPLTAPVPEVTAWPNETAAKPTTSHIARPRARRMEPPLQVNREKGSDERDERQWSRL